MNLDVIFESYAASSEKSFYRVKINCFIQFSTEHFVFFHKIPDYIFSKTTIFINAKTPIIYIEEIKMNEVSMQGLMHENKVKTCPDCGSKQLDYRAGELFCKKCGLIIDE